MCIAKRYLMLLSGAAQPKIVSKEKKVCMILVSQQSKKKTYTPPHFVVSPSLQAQSEPAGVNNIYIYAVERGVGSFSNVSPAEQRKGLQSKTCYKNSLKNNSENTYCNAYKSVSKYKR